MREWIAFAQIVEDEIAKDIEQARGRTQGSRLTALLKAVLAVVIPGGPRV